MNDSERTRLVKVLGMTGSAHDGEALAALRKAQAIMAERRVTWAELLTGRAVRANGHASDHRHQARWALSFPLPYTDYERQFLSDMVYRPGPLTEKQQALLRRILREVTRATGEFAP